MALRVWLPLTGDLKNRGADIDGTLTGTSFGDNGKIGAKFAYSNMGASCTFPSLVNLTNFSITYWIYVDSSASIQSWADIWSLGTQVGSTSTVIRDEFTSTAGNHQAIIGKDSTVGNNTNTYYGLAIGATSAMDKWAHIAIVKYDTVTKVYRDGALLTTHNNSNFESTPQKLTGVLKIGDTSSTAAKLNDFRVYDHCLSDKEIKEIAQGLILHYKLDEFNSGKIINWFGNGHYLYDCTYEPSSHPAYHVSHWGGSVRAGTTKDENYQNEGTVYVTFKTTENVGAVDWSAAGNIGLQYSKHQINPSDTRFNDMLPILMNINIGEYFTVSFESKCSDATYPYKIRTRIVTKLSSETSTTSTEINTTTFTTANSWDIYSATFQMTQTLYNRIHDSTNDRLILLFDIWYANTATMANNVTLELRKFQFELGNTRHEWERSPYDYGIMDIIEKDSSGYSHNGIVVNNPIIVSDSSRYGTCTQFNGSNQYIRNDLQMKNNYPTDEITVSWWGYMNSWSSYGRAISCTEGGGWNFEPASGGMRWAVGTGASSNTYITTCTSTTTLANLTSGWHHFVGTYDGFNAKLYIDGVLEKDITAYTTKTPLFYANVYLYIGCEASATTPYFNGKLSDVRIYATALSADDIKELYQIPVNIDNLYNMHVFELQETSDNILSLSAFEQGGLYDDGAGETTMTTRLRTLYIPVIPNTDYRISVADGIRVRGIHYFNKLLNWISYQDKNTQTATFTSPENCYYIRIPLQKSDNSATISLNELNTICPTLTTITINTLLLSNNPYNINIFKNGILKSNNISVSTKAKINKSGIIEANDFIEK